MAVSPWVIGWYKISVLRLTGIWERRPPVARFELFHYLDRKHADLVSNISGVFEQMKDGGELSAIRERVIRVLLERTKAGLPLCDDDYACFAGGATN